MLDERLSPPVVNAIVERAARAPGGARHRRRARRRRAAQPVLRQRADRAVRRALGGRLRRRDLDVPPGAGHGRGARRRRSCSALAWLNDRMSRRALESLQKEGRRASHYVESSLRNAEVLQALGMTQRLLARWRALQDQIARAADQHQPQHRAPSPPPPRLRAPGDPDPHAGARRLPGAHPAGLGRRHDRHHHPARPRGAAGRAAGRQLARADRGARRLRAACASCRRTSSATSRASPCRAPRAG